MEEELPLYMEKNGHGYILIGDYYYPLITLEEQKKPLGRWGRKHLRYLQEYEPEVCLELLSKGKLFNYLGEINEQAEERIMVIIKQMKAKLGPPEEMKNTDTLAWVGAMNNIRHSAEEIVLAELIYA